MKLYDDMKLEDAHFGWNAKLDDGERQLGIGCPLGQDRGAANRQVAIKKPVKCHYWPLTGIYAEPKFPVSLNFKRERTENQIMLLRQLLRYFLCAPRQLRCRRRLRYFLCAPRQLRCRRRLRSLHSLELVLCCIRRIRRPSLQNG